MKYYVGLDVSINETAVCVVNEDGKIVHETMVATEPKDIFQYLSSKNIAYDRIGIESSNLSIWLYKELQNYNYPVICIETRHAKAAMAAQNVKTDKNDARGIAQMMRTGWYKPVHIKSEKNQRIKMVINSRRCLVDQRIVIENHIRGILKTFGLKTGQTTKPKYEDRIKELITDDGELEMAISPLLEVRTSILRQIQILDKLLFTAVKADHRCQNLMTIPGVGPLTALLYIATIDDPNRFQRSRHVPVHLGLTPRKYASGEIDYNGRITKCGDSLLRSHLYEAASVILRRSTKKNGLKSWGSNIAKRSSTKNARVAVSRKLAIVMHQMWLTGKEFDWEAGLVQKQVA